MPLLAHLICKLCCSRWAVCHACVSICFAYIGNSSGNHVSHIVLLDSLLAKMQNQRLAKLWSSGGVNRIYSVYVTEIMVLARWTYKLTSDLWYLLAVRSIKRTTGTYRTFSGHAKHVVRQLEEQVGLKIQRLPFRLAIHRSLVHKRPGGKPYKRNEYFLKCSVFL